MAYPPLDFSQPFKPRRPVWHWIIVFAMVFILVALGFRVAYAATHELPNACNNAADIINSWWMPGEGL